MKDYILSRGLVYWNPQSTGHERYLSLHVTKNWRKNIPDLTIQWKLKRFGLENRKLHQEKSKIMFQISGKSNGKLKQG